MFLYIYSAQMWILNWKRRLQTALIYSFPESERYICGKFHWRIIVLEPGKRSSRLFPFAWPLYHRNFLLLKFLEFVGSDEGEVALACKDEESKPDNWFGRSQQTWTSEPITMLQVPDCLRFWSFRRCWKSSVMKFPTIILR